MKRTVAAVLFVLAAGALAPQENLSSFPGLFRNGRHLIRCKRLGKIIECAQLHGLNAAERQFRSQDPVARSPIGAPAERQFRSQDPETNLRLVGKTRDRRSSKPHHSHPAGSFPHRR
jgi:hypothetical protein